MKKNVQIVYGENIPADLQKEPVSDDDLFTSHPLSDPNSLTQISVISPSLERRSPTPESNPCGDFNFLGDDDLELKIDSDPEDVLSQEKDNSNNKIDHCVGKDNNSEKSLDPLAYPSLSNASIRGIENFLAKEFPSASKSKTDSNKENHSERKKKDFSKKISKQDKNKGSSSLVKLSLHSSASTLSSAKKPPSSPPVPIAGSNGRGRRR